MSQIRLNFTGIVVGRARREAGEQNVIVCTASKSKKSYSLLLLELIYPAYEFAQVEIPAIGAVISGSGQLSKIEDDFIGLHPQGPVKILPSDSEGDFDGKPWRSNRFPVMGRILIRQALHKSKRCLDMNLDWEWQSPYAPCKAFSQLLSGTLNDATSSLVTVSFSGLVLAGHRTHGSTHKNYLCLTTRQNPDYAQLPLLIDCESSNSSCHIARGDIIEVSDAPVLDVKNDLRILLLQCGQGHCSKVEKESADLNLLTQIYDELINLSLGEDAFWPALFRRKPKALCRQMLKQAYAKLDELGIKPGEIVHGWWHPDWGFFANVHEEKLLPDIKMVIPDFDAYAHSPRIMILPKGKKWNWCDFVEKGCSISVSDSPAILEGSIRPDGRDWELICRWIRLNKAALLKDFLDYNEIRDLSDVSAQDADKGEMKNKPDIINREGQL